MRPEEVPAGLVEKAMREYLPGLYDTGAEAMRHALAAVLPEVQAQVWDEAARVVHAEARHQTELAQRRSLGASYAAQRLLIVEKVLTDRAARLTTTTEEPT